jgi:hypothetical protein
MARLPTARAELAAAKILIAGRPRIVAVGGYLDNFTNETDVYAP